MRPVLPVYQPRDQDIQNTLINDPSSAQLQIWLAQAQRDHGMLSDNEMAVVERVAGKQAKQSITMFNPFTGELRKVDF